jgi:hypothetical protein
MAAPAGAIRTSHDRIRRGAVALGLAGLLLAVFPLIRPFGDDSSGGRQAVAATLASDAWVGSHLMLAVGFVLLNFGVMALYAHISATGVERLAFASLIVTLVGATLLVGVASVEGVALNAFGKLQLLGHAGCPGRDERRPRRARRPPLLGRAAGPGSWRCPVRDRHLAIRRTPSMGRSCPRDRLRLVPAVLATTDPDCRWDPYRHRRHRSCLAHLDEPRRAIRDGRGIRVATLRLERAGAQKAGRLGAV